MHDLCVRATVAARLQDLLASMKLSHSMNDVYNLFKERARDNKLTFACGDSTVASADQLRKLGALLRRAREAGVAEILKGLQVHNGIETWAAKWSTCVKINGICENKQEFGFMIRPSAY